MHNIILFLWFSRHKIFNLLCFEVQTDPPYVQQDHPFMKGACWAHQQQMVEWAIINGPGTPEAGQSRGSRTNMENAWGLQ